MGKEKKGDGRSYLGLPVLTGTGTTPLVRRLTAAVRRRAGQRAAPPPVCGVRMRLLLGTVARRIDGGALRLGRTRAPAMSHAVAPVFISRAAMAGCCCCSAQREKKRERAALEKEGRRAQGAAGTCSGRAAGEPAAATRRRLPWVLASLCCSAAAAEKEGRGWK